MKWAGLKSPVSHQLNSPVTVYVLIDSYCHTKFLFSICKKLSEL